MAESFEVGYAEGGKTLRVRAIAKWQRGEIVPVSGGSGLKDYVKNLVYLIFEHQPAIDQVVMVRAGGPPFLLLRAGCVWVDSTAKRVVVRGDLAA